MKITKDDIGRKFVTIHGKVVTIKAIDSHDALYPVATDNGWYTWEFKCSHWQDSGDNFSHWADEPAQPDPRDALIAKLLGVLKAFVNVCDNGNPMEFVKELGAVVEPARQAIAEAEGKP